MECGAEKEERGVGRKQFRWSNETPTCLQCAEANRQKEYLKWYDDPGIGDPLGPRRICGHCTGLKYQPAYSKKEWKREKLPACWECLQTLDDLEHALAELPPADRVLRCHTREVLDLVLRFQFVTWENVTAFLELCGDDEYAVESGFYAWRGYSAKAWMMNYALSAAPGDQRTQSLVAGLASKKFTGKRLSIRVPSTSAEAPR